MWPSLKDLCISSSDDGASGAAAAGPQGAVGREEPGAQGAAGSAVEQPGKSTGGAAGGAPAVVYYDFPSVPDIPVSF